MTSREYEVVPADPVYDAELVDEGAARTARPSARQVVASWWQRSPKVPLALKNRQAAMQAAKDLVVRVLRSPFRFIGAVARGLVAAARWWRKWVRVHDYRDAAEQSEKLADKFTEIRALTLFRWKVTSAVAVASV